MATAGSICVRKSIAVAALVCLALALAFVCGPSSVSAHAELTGSDPAAGQALAEFPLQVSLTFSETVDPALSSVTVLDADGSPTAARDLSVDQNDAHTLLAVITDAPDATGVFTVLWGAYSTEDGHPSSGSFTFSVGTGEAPAQSSSIETRPAIWAIAGKWLELMALVLLSGLAWFVVANRLVLSPALSTTAMLLAGIGLLGALLSFRAREADVTGGSMLKAPAGPVVSDLLASTYGNAWLVRVVVLVLALGCAWTLRRWPNAKTYPVIAGCGLLGLGTIALSGHARGAEHPWLTAGIDWLHMLAATFWLGGLLGLLLLISPCVDLPGERALLRRQGNRFAVAVIVIIVSGIASAFWHIGGWRSLQASDYGRTLLLKIGLVGVLLGVAYYNRKVLQGERGRANLIPVAIGAELVLGSVVLFFSADLSQTPPANRPLPMTVAARAIELDSVADSGNSTIKLTGILTGDPTDEIRIEVNPADDLQRVIVRSEFASQINGEFVGDRFDAVAVEGNPGVYAFSAGRLGIAGHWMLDITVRRAGVSDDIATFPVDTSTLSTRASSVAADTWGEFRVTPHTALALTLAGLMLVIGLGGLRRVTGLEPLASGFLLAASLLIAGGFLVSAARSTVPVTPDHPLANPIVSSASTLIYAGELYRLNCAACHGPDGQGVENGSAAHLHGSSADLTRGSSVGQSDGDLRYWIAHGIPGTRMPAFDAALTSEEQWQLVLLIRQLQEDARKDADRE